MLSLGIEPATSPSLARRSNQLSYAAAKADKICYRNNKPLPKPSPKDSNLGADQSRLSN